MDQQVIRDEYRTQSQVRHHYEIERELASKLRDASKPERRYLYSCLYDELYRRVPDHPQLTRRSSPVERARTISSQVRFLKRFVTRDTTFLEIGPGDCALSLQLAYCTKTVYAVDVSAEIAQGFEAPENFHLILSDGCSIPVNPNSVNVAYSNQLMEHLHPDDAVEQLQNIYRALNPGGTYVCVTPNRLTGPHDVSRDFDPVATGFHLKEYTIAELRALFQECGFVRIQAYVGAKGMYVKFPTSLLIVCEKLLCTLPPNVRKRIVSKLLFRMLLNIRLSATK